MISCGQLPPSDSVEYNAVLQGFPTTDTDTIAMSYMGWSCALCKRIKNPTSPSSIQCCCISDLFVFSFYNPTFPPSSIIRLIVFNLNSEGIKSVYLSFDDLGCFSIVVQQFFDQINMRQHHSAAAISLQTQFVQSISVLELAETNREGKSKDQKFVRYVSSKFRQHVVVS